MKKLLNVVLVIGMLLSSIQVHATSNDTITFEKINKDSDIIPGLRYIIVGEEEWVDGKIHTGGFAVNPRSSKGVDIKKNEDGTITVDEDSELIFRFEAVELGSSKSDGISHRYYIKPNSNSYVIGGKYNTSVRGYSVNQETWWYVKAQSNNQWLIATRSNGTQMIISYYNEYFDGVELMRSCGDVNRIPLYNSDIYIYREVCPHEKVKFVGKKEATCEALGYEMHYECLNCGFWSKNKSFTQMIDRNDQYIPTTNHQYENGECVACHTKNESLQFEKVSIYSYGNQCFEGRRHIIVGQDGDKYYAMGNITEDGHRNAVEVTMLENGRIEANGDVEILTFDRTQPTNFQADGYQFGIENDEYVMRPLYDYTLSCIYGSMFLDWFYVHDSDENVDQYFTFVPGEKPYFTVTNEKTNSASFYAELCHHPLPLISEDAPNCMEAGVEKYLFCTFGHDYYLMDDLINPVITSDREWVFPKEEFRTPALGHDYQNGVCLNCGIEVPRYTKVTSIEQIIENTKDTNYILGTEVGGKVYALSMKTENNLSEVTQHQDGSISVINTSAEEFWLMKSGSSDTTLYGMLATGKWICGKNEDGTLDEFTYYLAHKDNTWPASIASSGQWDLNFEEDGALVATAEISDEDPNVRIRCRVLTNVFTGEKEISLINGKNREVPMGYIEEILPVYLYESKAIYTDTHVHQFGEWEYKSKEDKHQRQCVVCGEVEFEPCVFEEEGTIYSESTFEKTGTIHFSCGTCWNGYTEDLPLLMMGDVNNDGVINNKDRMILTRYLAKWDGYGEEVIVRLDIADVNKDGYINAKDRMILTRFLAEWSGYESLGEDGSE